MSGYRVLLDMLLFGGSLYLLWVAHRARERLAAWKALFQQNLQVVRETSGMLDTALDLATKQQAHIAALEGELQDRP